MTRPGPHIARHPLGAVLAIVAVLFVVPAKAGAQMELLPIDHPASRLLVRINEAGGLAGFPREHLPISVGTALQFLETVMHDASVATPLRDDAIFQITALRAMIGESRNKALIAVDDSSDAFFKGPFEDTPLTILSWGDSASRSHIVVNPIGEVEYRTDPDASKSAVVASFGGGVHGTVGGHVGFGALAVNGSIAGDLDLVRRDSTISHNGSFGITGFGRDISYGDGHARIEAWNCGLEIGREPIALGGDGEESLLLSSNLPTRVDYLRLTARVGKLAYSHIHAALLGTNSTAGLQGPFADIPQKYAALHLLSVGPFAGVRVSVGESVVYARRGMEIGYLNPLSFLKTQEQYLRDRDNSNFYFSFGANPVPGLFLDGEFLLDDLRFSLIGDGFWGNKTAWRVGVRAVGLGVASLAGGITYTRLEPYVYTHFNVVNNYTHDGVNMAGIDLQPNSYSISPWLEWRPFSRLTLNARVEIGRHGANVHVRDSITGKDSLMVNVGGDINQTRRGGLDSEHVTFLDGNLEEVSRIRLVVEYEPIRNVYLRMIGLNNRRVDSLSTKSEGEIRMSLRVGVH